MFIKEHYLLQQKHRSNNSNRIHRSHMPITDHQHQMNRHRSTVLSSLNKITVMARTCNEAKLTKFPFVRVSSFLVIPYITSLYSVRVILKMVEQKVIPPV